MERLTNRNYNYELFENAVIGLDTQNSEELIMPKSLLDMVNKLQELENKIENGTFIELPCKLGDKVYFINPIKNEIVEDIVYLIEFYSNKICIHCNTHCDTIEYYNKEWFTDKELAEKKLEEIKNGKINI